MLQECMARFGGGIVGARAGKQVIPDAWLDGIIEWPRTVSWMERLGVTLAEALDEPTGNIEVPVCSVPGLLPPY